MRQHRVPALLAQEFVTSAGKHVQCCSSAPDSVDPCSEFKSCRAKEAPRPGHASQAIGSNVGLLRRQGTKYAQVRLRFAVSEENRLSSAPDMSVGCSNMLSKIQNVSFRGHMKLCTAGCWTSKGRTGRPHTKHQGSFDSQQPTFCGAWRVAPPWPVARSACGVLVSC
jgi:hypothetical protein